MTKQNPKRRKRLHLPSISNSPKKDNGPRGILNYQRKTVEFVFDTGAEANIISKQACKYLGDKLQECNKVITTVNDHKLKTFGQIRISMSVSTPYKNTIC